MAKRKGSHRRVTVRKPAPSGIALTADPDAPAPGTRAINPKGRKGVRDMMRTAAPAPAPDHSDQLGGGKVSRQVARQAVRLEAKRLASEERAKRAKGKRRENRNGKGNGKDGG